MSNLRDALEEAITWPSSGTLQLAQAGWRKVAWEYDRALAAPQPEPSAGLRAALLHLAMRRHDASDGCDGCLNVKEQVAAALAAEDAP